MDHKQEANCLFKRREFNLVLFTFGHYWTKWDEMLTMVGHMSPEGKDNTGHFLYHTQTDRHPNSNGPVELYTSQCKGSWIITEKPEGNQYKSTLMNFNNEQKDNINTHSHTCRYTGTHTIHRIMKTFHAKRDVDVNNTWCSTPSQNMEPEREWESVVNNCYHNLWKSVKKSFDVVQKDNLRWFTTFV